MPPPRYNYPVTLLAKDRFFNAMTFDEQNGLPQFTPCTSPWCPISLIDDLLS